MSKEEDAEISSPLDRAGIISRATFWWVVPTLQQAHARGKLDKGDLPQLAQADQPGRLSRAFEGAFVTKSCETRYPLPRISRGCDAFRLSTTDTMTR